MIYEGWLLKLVGTWLCWLYSFEGTKNRDKLIEATSSQKKCATSISTGNQGGEPTLSH